MRRHGIDERVSLRSVVESARVLGLLVRAGIGRSDLPIPALSALSIQPSELFVFG
jgi:hypothetical protein